MSSRERRYSASVISRGDFPPGRQAVSRPAERAMIDRARRISAKRTRRDAVTVDARSFRAGERGGAGEDAVTPPSREFRRETGMDEPSDGIVRGRSGQAERPGKHRYGGHELI